MIPGFENTTNQLHALKVCGDLISRQEAIEAVKRAEAMVRAFGYQAAVDAVRGIPAEPERNTGKWIFKQTGGEAFIVCSECGRIEWNNAHKFCPNCGANMGIK